VAGILRGAQPAAVNPAVTPAVNPGQAAFDDVIARLDGPVVWFPVRHHSPAAARLVRECIACVRPKAVLIEGPADFNPQFAELHRAHKLPVAVYSYVQFDDGRRAGAFYPFCEYSPEWQAIETANTGKPCMKLVVPSKGSMIHTVSLSPLAPLSSARNACCG